MYKSHLTLHQAQVNTEDFFSSSTVGYHGLQQYWTPPQLAQWLRDVLIEAFTEHVINEALVCDLTAGAGNLLQPYKHRCGTELDKTVITRGLNVVNADLVKFYPYLYDSGIQFDIFALNPPYAEYWSKQVFTEGHETERIESQIATVMAANSLLQYYGIGYAVLSSKIVDKLLREINTINTIVTIDGVFKPHADVQVAIVFFGKIYHREPIELKRWYANSLDELPALEDVAESITRYVYQLYPGKVQDTLKAFKEAYRKYREDQEQHKWKYNLEAQGRSVRLSFSNFQRLKLGEKPTRVPLAYYIFNPDKLETLYQKIKDWNEELPVDHRITVDPKFLEALQEQKRRSEREMTPYYRLKEFQKLGWLHSMKEIRCKKTTEIFLEGNTYSISTRIANAEQNRVEHHEHSETYYRKVWKYLEIILQSEHDPIHFNEDDGAEFLATHFEMPAVLDVSEKYRGEYEQNLRLVELFQDRYQFKVYQKDLLARIMTKKQDGLAVLLSAEQGMGKTRMSLALIELLGVKKTLIITKTKVLDQFPKEAQAVGFPWPVQKITDIRTALAAKEAQAGVFVSTYAILSVVGKKNRNEKATISEQEIGRRKEQETVNRTRIYLDGEKVFLDLRKETLYSKGKWMYRTRFKGIYTILKDAFTHGMVILDETTTAKKKQTVTSKAVYSLKARHKVGLSGEPIDNYLNDIYWTCLWLFGENNPLFPYSRASAQRFIDDYLKVEQKTTVFEHDAHDTKGYIKVLPEIANVSLLWKLIAPLFIVRRWSDLGEDEMVGLRIRTWDVPFSQEQLTIYQEWQETMEQFIHSAAGKDGSIVNMIGGYLNKLRQVACLPSSQSLRYDVGRDEFGEQRTWGGTITDNPFTPKVETVLTLIKGCLSEGRQCVLFVLYKEEAKFYSRVLRKHGVWVRVVTGEVSSKKLLEINRSFKFGNCKVVVATILACAEGIDWNWCSRVIFTTTTWRASKLRQAMHRCRRINSTQDVQIDIVLTDESIDYKAYNLQLRKGRSSDMCLQGEIKEEYEAEGMKTLVKEGLQHVEATDQEPGTLIEARCRQIFADIRTLLKPRVEPREISRQAAAALAVWKEHLKQAEAGSQLAMPF